MENGVSELSTVGAEVAAASPAKCKRGFASIPPERRRAIASLGGKAAHALGKAHEFTSETGARARMEAAARGVKFHKFTSEQARAAGRLGGLARAAKRASV